jgi:flagellar hook-associated protein 1 FlgK
VADLFTSLTSAARALDAQRFGLDVAGQNIANVNTPGYARRVADLSAVAPYASGTAGSGVDVTGIRALRDTLLEARLQREVPLQSREAAVASALSVVESALGRPGTSIDAALDTFFNSFASLAEDPTSSNARREVVLQGEALAASFRDMAGRFDSARVDADRNVRALVEDVNSLTSRIADLNATIGSATDPEASLHARDEQFQLVRQLSELVDIGVLERPEGGLDITIGSGRALVVGNTDYAVSVSSTAPLGLAAISVNGATITTEIDGGKMGGFLHVRDTSVPAYLSLLDDLAYEVADQVNTLHTAGFDQTGAAAGDFFAFSTAPTGTAGAASYLIVDAAVAADPRLVAAADAAAAGNNETARAIAAVRHDRVMVGNTATLNDAWAQLVYRVGRDTQVATDERDGRAEIVRQVEALRDEVSGVSLDEEAMHLLKFQRAYEANARFFTLIDETLRMMLNMVS